MLSEDLSIKYVTEVQRNLQLQGYWGFSEEKLLDELRDHFALKVEKLKCEGHSALEAQEITEKALGALRAIACE